MSLVQDALSSCPVLGPRDRRGWSWPRLCPKTRGCGKNKLSGGQGGGGGKWLFSVPSYYMLKVPGFSAEAFSMLSKPSLIRSFVFVFGLCLRPCCLQCPRWCEIYHCESNDARIQTLPIVLITFVMRFPSCYGLSVDREHLRLRGDMTDGASLGCFIKHEKGQSAVAASTRVTQ